MLLGTAAYMPPEQARGRPVDRRADIWAFGVTLFEMLTAKPLFAGETVSDTIARVLEREPAWEQLPRSVPRGVRELLRRCLVKDPRRRLRDMGDVRLELDAAIESLTAGEPGEPKAGPRRRTLATAFTALALAALAGGFGLRAALGPGPQAPLRFSVVAPGNLRVGGFVIGPDVRGILATARPRATGGDGPAAIYRRMWDEFEWKPVPGTEGTDRWVPSADGRWIYMIRRIAEGSRRMELQRLPLDGSAPPSTVMPWPDNLTWFVELPDGSIAAFEAGFTRLAVFAPGSTQPRWVKVDCDHALVGLEPTEVFPDGKAVLVNVRYYGAGGWTESAGLVDLHSGRVDVLEEVAGSPKLTRDGWLLMTRHDVLLASRWDAARRRPAGPPVAVLSGLGTQQAFEHAEIEVSPQGDIAYMPGGAVASRRSLAIVHLDGRAEAWSGEQRTFDLAPASSPDGRFVAAVDVPPGSAAYEIVLLERGRDGARRFAASPGGDCTNPVFSPDGRWLAWSLQGPDSIGGLYVQPLDGHAAARRLTATHGPREWDNALGWTRDGRSILVESRQELAATGLDMRLCLRRITLSGDTARVSDVVRAPFNVGDGALSPDGGRIAYVSSEAGYWQVVVALLRADGRAGDPVPVSRGRGGHPVWSRDGARLYWETPGNALYSADVSKSLDVGAPKPLVDLSAIAAGAGAYSLLPDGDLLITRKADGEGEIRRIDVVRGFRAVLAQAVRRASASPR